MKELKFKIGDKVQIIENDNGSVNHIGDIGFIKYVEYDDETELHYSVLVNGREDSGNWHTEYELKLVDDLTEDLKELKDILSNTDTRILTDNHDRIIIHRLCIEFGINLYNIECHDEDSPTRDGSYDKLEYHFRKDETFFGYTFELTQTKIIFKDIISKFNKYKK